MPITGKERSTYSLKPSLEGTERIIVNGTHFITPAQILAQAASTVLVKGYYYNGSFYSDAAHTQEITLDTEHLYQDILTGKTYNYSDEALPNFVRSVSVSGNTLTLTLSNGTEVEFTPEGGGEPDEYIKSVSVSGDTLTFTRKNNTTQAFTPATPQLQQIDFTHVSGYSASARQVLENVNGTMQWVTATAVLVGSSSPSSAQGNNGDIYVQR